MAKNDFQHGGWNHYTLPCGTITTLISPGDCTLQCAMWLWNHDSEFTKWQQPVMWYVALGWHAMEFAQTSAILEFYIWFRFLRYHRSRHVVLHHSLRNFIQIGPTSAEKMTSCRFSRWQISGILVLGTQNFMVSLKSPYIPTTSYRSLIETIALNCLVSQKITVFAFWRQTDKQTDRRTRDKQMDKQADRQTNRWTAPMH